MIKKILLKVLAIFVCLIILAVWQIFLELQGVKSGLGGAIPVVLLYFVLREVWRKINGLGTKDAGVESDA
jgi:hypothetical protein